MTYDEINEIDPKLWAKVRSETETVIRLAQATGMTAVECHEIVKAAKVHPKL